MTKIEITYWTPESVRVREVEVTGWSVSDDENFIRFWGKMPENKFQQPELVFNTRHIISIEEKGWEDAKAD
jgi:predicted metalloprotease with PDZ domain